MTDDSAGAAKSSSESLDELKTCSMEHKRTNTEMPRIPHGAEAYFPGKLTRRSEIFLSPEFPPICENNAFLQKYLNFYARLVIRILVSSFSESVLD